MNHEQSLTYMHNPLRMAALHANSSNTQVPNRTINFFPEKEEEALPAAGNTPAPAARLAV